MLVARDVQVRAGAHLLLEHASFQVARSPEVGDRAMAAYACAEAELAAAGGYAAEAEAARIASNIGLPERVLHQPIGLFRAVSDGELSWPGFCFRERRRCCSTSRRTTGLLERCVNKVFHIDANRAELDIHVMGWQRYLQQRETDEKRRRRERLNAERKAGQLFSQADKMRAKAPPRRWQHTTWSGAPSACWLTLMASGLTTG